MSIYKTIYTVTVLSDEPISPHLDIAQVIENFDTGPWLGHTEQHPSEEIPVNRIVEEQEALGNDGSFFDPEDYDCCTTHGSFGYCSCNWREDP